MKLRIIAYIFLGFLTFCLLVNIGVYVFQKRIIFQSTPLAQDYTFEFDAPFEEHFLTTPEGLKINALYFPTPLHRKGVVLYFHGNADNLQRWGQYHPDLTSRGYDVFMIDYRCYGKSEGQADVKAYYRDARMAYDWLLQKFAAEDIILYGRSLGSAMASNLASTVPARMLILETPFDDLRHALQLNIPLLYLPWNLDYPFANDQHLAAIDYPVYIFHGTKDRVVPYSSAMGLQPLLQDKDRFFTIPGGGPKNLSEFEDFQTGLEEVLGNKKK